MSRDRGAARRRPSSTSRRCAGRTSGSRATTIITTASTADPDGPGAEVEASRGCPYHCSFCAKIDFRDKYRRRDLAPLLEEIDGLSAQGVGYLYFIDEIFLPQRPLLEALVGRGLHFGIQTRIDLWKPEMLDLLGAAGCVSIEAGVESLTRGRPRRARQELPHVDRRPRGAADATRGDPCPSCRRT